MLYLARPNIKFQSEQKIAINQCKMEVKFTTSSETHVTGGGMQKMLNPFSSICWNMIEVVIIFLKWKVISDLHLNQFIEKNFVKIGLELIGTFRPYVEKRPFPPGNVYDVF